MPFQTGSLLAGRFLLERELSALGAKQTWLGRDQTSGEAVSVKLLFFGRGMQWQDLRLFEREAETLASLTHPRIPRFVASFWVDAPEGSYRCLVARYIPGTSLADLVASGKRFAPSQALTLAGAVLEVLVYLHAQVPPVIHRDIKPGNLIVGDDGETYLIDFGAVQAPTPGATVTVVGTFGYMPPEQFGGRAVPASDLYALGMTLLTLLSGVPPQDWPQVNLQVQIRGKLGLDARFERWLEKLLAPTLDRRFPAAREALDSLRRLQSKPPSSPALAPLDATVILPPAGSRLRLESAPERLRLVIPGRNIRLIELPELGVAGVWLLAACLGTISAILTHSPPAWAVLVLWLATFGFALWKLWPLIFETEIVLEGDRFRVTSGVPGLFTLRRAGQMFGGGQAVREVVWSTRMGDSDQYRCTYLCTLRTDTTRVRFGHGLDESEQAWLVEQINRWLGH